MLLKYILYALFGHVWEAAYFTHALYLYEKQRKKFFLDLQRTIKSLALATFLSDVSFV